MVDVEKCIEIIHEEIDEVDDIWYEKYRSPKKFELIDEVIEKYNRKFEDEDCQIKSWATPKAISTHSPRWTGWRRSRSSDAQYCLHWYGGYVYCVEFLTENPEIKEKLKEFW